MNKSSLFIVSAAVVEQWWVGSSTLNAPIQKILNVLWLLVFDLDYAGWITFINCKKNIKKIELYMNPVDIIFLLLNCSGLQFSGWKSEIDRDSLHHTSYSIGAYSEPGRLGA